jgi:hypothetical protein
LYIAFIKGGRILDARHVLCKVRKRTGMLELGFTTTVTAITM